MRDNKKLNVKRSTFAKVIIAMLIFVVSSAGNFDRASAAENDRKEENSEVSVYNVDDVRELVGISRKIDYTELERIRVECGRLGMTDEQKKKVSDILGNIEEPSATEKAKIIGIDERLEQFQKSMREGYNPDLVIEYYKTAKSQIGNYESLYGQYNITEDNSARINEIIAIVDEIRPYYNSNVVVGSAIGNDMNLPFELSEVAGSFEPRAIGTAFLINKSSSELKAVFNGVIDEYESLEYEDTFGGKHTGKMIKIKTGEYITCTYYGDIEIDKTLKAEIDKGNKPSVKQGDTVANANREYRQIVLSLFIDGERVDVLKLFGTNGAILKQQYIDRHPDEEYLISLWDELNSGRLKGRVNHQTRETTVGTGDDSDKIISDYVPGGYSDDMEAVG